MEDLKELKAMLSGWSSEDETPFSTIVSQWLKVTGQPERVLAGEFEAAISTIHRWSDGSVAPHPLMQEHVAETLEEATEQIIKQKGVKDEGNT